MPAPSRARPRAVRDRQPPDRYTRIVALIQGTPLGEERTMYPHIRDLFVYILGHEPELVRTEPPGDHGAADVEVNVRRPGEIGSLGLPALVIEAKDERDVCFPLSHRNALYAAKRKYITFSTRWFILVDPIGMVARPVVQGRYGGGDLEFRWSDAGGEDAFVSVFAPLSAARSGFDDLLSRFREGDPTLIATLKLDGAAAPDVVRDQFFQSLADAAAALQHATRAALEGQRPHTMQLKADLEAMSDRYGTVTVRIDPIRVTGAPQGPDATRAFRRDAARFERELERAPRLARLAFKALPETAIRTGLDTPAEESALLDMFAAETSSLILARVLLIRFFEDHRFFGERRYVCNGGVDAFRRMMEYFKTPYTRLLEHAYAGAAQFYAAAFADTDLDWILEDASDVLSRGLEWAMFLLSQYDFRTVRGDILSGVYERFINAKQRKEFGEVYTPPSIARFILERIGVQPGDRLLDPACGSGTFLIEAYEHLVGEAAARGVATWRDARVVLASIAGNDKNRFSAVLSQIQMLWHVLGFREDIARDGFPELQVVEGADSLVIRTLLDDVDRFSEIDVAEYAAVVGNPPYVRSERQTGTTDMETARFYNEYISAKTNLYGMFLFRALSTWCRPASDGVAPGRVGFIIPQALCDANQQSALRNLFGPNGRWRILELADLETIGPEVFDADVVPLIFLAERRAPLATDMVVLRTPDADALIAATTPGGRPHFNLAASPAHEMPYASVFAPDGRILTRVTPARREILDVFFAQSTLESAARSYWARAETSGRLIDATTDPVRAATRGERWVTKLMLSGGVAFRGTYATAPDGLDVYKGENVISLDVIGEPSHGQTNMRVIDDPSLWRFPHILPHVAYAIPRIEQLPNCARFDPHQQAFENTVTVFVPRADLEDVPFDILLHSRVYRFAYAIGYRMGVLFRRRSNLYPQNVKQLPWNDSLRDVAPDIEALRAPLLAAYQLINERETSLDAVATTLELPRLRDVVRAKRQVRLEWTASFSDAGRVTPITCGRDDVTNLADAPHRVTFGDSMFDYVMVHGDGDVAACMAVALQMQIGRRITREEMLDMPMPATAEQARAMLDALVLHAARDPIAEREALLDQLDSFVGSALGLSAAQITEIQRDLREDPFLRTLGVREPFTTTRIRGIRHSLARSDRYQ